MAIDSTLFAVDIPAGTYTVGDVVPLVCTDGPANVRSGRGAAKLKSICTFKCSQNNPYWRIHVKNSDWIDEVLSFTAPGTATGSVTIFDDESGVNQSGHDCNLTPNSGWQIYAECILGGTSTGADSVFCLIDIDYPEVGGVTDPKKAVGFPTSISYDVGAQPVNAIGSGISATWNTKSVDYFKAGYRYVLDALEFTCGNSTIGFVAFSNAAGMGGLTRIIPVTSNMAAIRYSIKYSSVLVKGPMEVKLKLFQTSAGSENIVMSHDYVKQKA